MSGRDQSDAIWIRQQEEKSGRNQSDFGSSFSSRFGFTRSMSVNSEGASTNASSSPPYSPIDNMSGNKSAPWSMPPPGNGRFRTSSFSSGYGSSYGKDRQQEEKDPYLIHSPLSTSAPGRENLFRRSNSISVGALEHNHYKNAKNANLGPIDEYSKMATFGNAFKSSIGQLFSTPKLAPPPPARNQLPSGIKEKQGQMKDRVVSMLCESAIR